MATYIALLVACLLIFRWISEAAAAWFEIVLQSRSPRPLLLASVATALILVVGAFGMATFVVLLSVMVTPWRQEGTVGIYMYGMAAGLPIIVASLAVWAFPLAAAWWQRPVMPARPAPWVFLDGASPEISSREPVRVRAALSTGIVMGLLFWLSWEALYFRGYLPSAISEAIYSVFELLFAATARIVGDRSFLLPASAACFQAAAAAIAAAGATRLNAVCGLFAASVASFIIVVGYCLFFAFQFDTVVQFVGLGAIAALPTAIVAAAIAGGTRRLSARTTVARQVGDLVAVSRGRRAAWAVLSKGSLAALCIVVAIGMAARVGQVVQANAYRASAERGDSDAQYSRNSRTCHMPAGTPSRETTRRRCSGGSRRPSKGMPMRNTTSPKCSSRAGALPKATAWPFSGCAARPSRVTRTPSMAWQKCTPGAAA